MAVSTGPVKKTARRGNLHAREGVAGWLFTLPAIIIVGVFLAIPVLMALWVSVSNWKGFGPPIGGRAKFVGLEELRRRRSTSAVDGPALAQKDFGTSIRNNFYYVLLGGAAADRARPVPRGAGEPAAAARQGVLPHRVLLPVGDQLDRDHDDLAVPVHRIRCRQPGAASVRRQRTELVQRPQWHHPQLCSGMFGVDQRAVVDERPGLPGHQRLGVDRRDRRSR